ncbi:hypothetical protein V5O48_018993 [Marasmius crinis-equi]|uniref:C2H2-type domain-containing protein n=1 Tax=Marasmius crinis-equi TaxID=585013 RepID=A0ABR3EJM3_9AGAR
MTRNPKSALNHCYRCHKAFDSIGGLARHEDRIHPPSDDPPESNEECQKRRYTYLGHPHFTGMPCDTHGEFYTGPPQRLLTPEPDVANPDAWFPFDDRATFDWVHFQFVELQASEGKINKALDILKAQLMSSGGSPPFSNAQDVYRHIDSIREENTMEIIPTPLQR